MIANTTRGGGFRGVLAYVFGPGKKDEERAILLGGSMMGRTPRELIREFGELRKLRPDCKNPVKHISFAIAPGEHLEQWQWLEVGTRKASQEGWDNWCMVQHTDEPHEHVHFVGSRITHDGQVIRETGFDIAKTEELCRQIEKKFGLRQLASPKRSESGKKIPIERVRKSTKNEKKKIDRTGDQSIRKLLQEQIEKAAADARTPVELMEILWDKHVEVEYTMKGKNIGGISFRIEGNDVSMSGSSLGIAFKWASLAARLESNKLKEVWDGARDYPVGDPGECDISWATGVSSSAVSLVGCASGSSASAGVEGLANQVAPGSGELETWWQQPEGLGGVDVVGEMLAGGASLNPTWGEASVLGNPPAGHQEGLHAQDLDHRWRSPSAGWYFLGGDDATRANPLSGPEGIGMAEFLERRQPGRGESGVVAPGGRKGLFAPGAPVGTVGGRPGVGLVGQSGGGPVPHPLMVEAEETLMDAKIEARQILDEVRQAGGVGDLDDWLPIPVPMDLVGPLPPPPGHQEPPLSLRMVWQIRNLWQGVRDMVQLAQEGLNRLGIIRERSMSSRPWLGRNH